jgi:hypothetical protein
MQVNEVPFLNIFDPHFRIDSDDVRAARAASWYARTPLGYSALRYEDVLVLLRDPRLHQGSAAMLKLRGVKDGPLVGWWDKALLNMDGADHTRLRRLVAKAFTPPAIERLRPYFKATAERLIDAFAASGHCEFMTAFSDRYPLEGICELLGIPVEKRDGFCGWASDLGLIFSPLVADPQVRARIETSLLALSDCVKDVLAERRREPKDDLITALLQAEEDGDRLSEEELHTNVVGLVFAGNDTTRNQLGLGLLAFTRFPEQWALLAERPDLAPRAVDEIMRKFPTISGIPRIATEAFEHRGVRFEAGTVFGLMLGSANVDEAVFGEAPFDITVERPAAQMTFGGGIHRCLGMWLARAEMQEALVTLAQRLDRIELDGAPSWLPGQGIVGPTALPLRFGARAV